MNIDFHHGVTYVVTRLAGFSHEDAQTVAISSQYVDDATDSGVLEFKTKELYKYSASAHKNLDYRNFKNLKNHMVWIPFHFLPGGEFDENETNVPEFIQKITTKPNSEVAQDMVKSLFKRLNDKNFLHQLGITMHVYADTWAHQGFAGIDDQINEIKDITHMHKGEDFHSNRKKFYGKMKWNGAHKRSFWQYLYNSSFWKYSEGLKLKLWEKVVSKFISNSYPLGHGALLSFPDRPYLCFEYKDGYGRQHKRENFKIFSEAVRHMYHWLKCLKEGTEPESGVMYEMLEKDFETIVGMFTGLAYECEHERYDGWIKAIKAGVFSFGSEDIGPHSPDGEKSWVSRALNVMSEDNISSHQNDFSDQFNGSDWKLFRDALEMHRTIVINDILPRYDICVA
ncbi:hypothetical protein N9W79_01740 [bacterium]|nr:hypothetical protein [bacterium]